MSALFSVRRVRPSDLDRIQQIEHASFGKDAYDRKLFADFQHMCGDLFLVVGSGENLWGYIITCLRGDQAELVSIAIHPDARAKGAGSALMESTLRRLRRRRITRIVLMVRVTNRKALAFYRKYGFRKVRLVRAYYRKGSDGVRMVKELRRPPQPL